MKAEAETPAKGLGDESRWDENGDLIQPDPATIAAVAAASAAAVTAESLARWDRQQKQEQEQRLRQLLVEMKEAVEDDGDRDVGRHRPALRRGSSTVDSHRSSSRVSISGSGMFQALATDSNLLLGYPIDDVFETVVFELSMCISFAHHLR